MAEAFEYAVRKDVRNNPIVREVDTAAKELCTALGDQFESQGTTLPMSFVRQGAVQLMTLRAQALQIAAQCGYDAVGLRRRK